MDTTENPRALELLAQKGLESMSQKLFNSINDLIGNHEASRRWVWELLQNAKDVIGNKGAIEITLTEQSVEFSHNGSPFQQNQLLALLSQTSTKATNYTDDEKLSFLKSIETDDQLDNEKAKEFLDTSGKFGTGFMTTYLLSRKINLESLYSMNGSRFPFKLSLDRHAEKPDEMKDKVRQSFNEFTDLERSIQSNNLIADKEQSGSYTTKFIYEFEPNSKGIKVAEIGVLDLHNSIPYTLSFIENIDQVSVNEKGKITIYRRMNPEVIKDISISRIRKEVQGEQPELIEIAKVSSKYNSLTIAVPVECIGGNKYRILFPSDVTPRQFISFPLIGSEFFPFPVIINSPLFNPNDSRSYIKLNDPDEFNKMVQLNRKLFEKAIELYKILINTTIEFDWENIFFLAKSESPKDIEDNWFKERIQKEIRTLILDSKVVQTENESIRIKPKEVKFPVQDEVNLEEFWELCKYVISDKIPRKGDVLIWKQIIEADPNDWLDIDFKFNLESLLELIQGYENHESFSKSYFSSQKDSFEALNQIILFTEKIDKELINRKEKPYKILPCQDLSSSFRSKNELSKDAGLFPFIKEVLKTIGEDWYLKLVHDGVTAFDRDSKLTLKMASTEIKEKIEKDFLGKSKEEERPALCDGLFQLIGYSNTENLDTNKTLYKFLKVIFHEKNLTNEVQFISDAEDFDWEPCQRWILVHILKSLTNCKNLFSLSKLVFDETYPEIKEEYSESEDVIRFRVDTFLNEIIKFSIEFENNKFHLLEDYGIIPNQLNELCKYNNELCNDVDIPEPLKKILLDFGYDCRKSLLHKGVSVNLNEKRDIDWICSQLDDVVIKEQDNKELKQPIRELDKWISKRKDKDDKKRMDELFKRFNHKRHGIVLNTYEINERDQFDEILKSGLSESFADIVRNGTKVEIIQDLVTLSKDSSLENAISILKNHPDLTTERINQLLEVEKAYQEIESLSSGKGISKTISFLQLHPDLTPERIEQLLELEELSKGFDPTMTYDPNEEQIRKNFETGWKGEAFVFKTLLTQGFNVVWPNKSLEFSENRITDFTGETHFISDQGNKYDLVINRPDGKVIYIQVKTTTTNINSADKIALPISVREWRFVEETTEEQSYYLARVFNINGNPEVYYMKVNKGLLK